MITQPAASELYCFPTLFAFLDADLSGRVLSTLSSPGSKEWLFTFPKSFATRNPFLIVALCETRLDHHQMTQIYFLQSFETLESVVDSLRRVSGAVCS